LFCRRFLPQSHRDSETGFAHAPRRQARRLSGRSVLSRFRKSGCATRLRRSIEAVLSRLALARQRFVRLDSCFVADSHAPRRQARRLSGRSVLSRFRKSGCRFCGKNLRQSWPRSITRCATRLRRSIEAVLSRLALARQRFVRLDGFAHAPRRQARRLSGRSVLSRFRKSGCRFCGKNLPIPQGSSRYQPEIVRVPQPGLACPPWRIWRAPSARPTPSPTA
jgi:hypothetical protein